MAIYVLDPGGIVFVFCFRLAFYITDLLVEGGGAILPCFLALVTPFCSSILK